MRDQPSFNKIFSFLTDEWMPYEQYKKLVLHLVAKGNSQF